MILNNTRYRRKICVFCSILTAVLIALCFRLFYLMIVKGGYYSKKASALQERERDIAGIRGDIVDRNERIIATNETAYNISVIHNQITDKEAVISVLSSELSIDEKTIRSKVDKVTSIEKIKNNVSKKTGDKILSYGLAGIKVDESSVRYYPLDELFSKVIGFAGADGQGVVGLETTYDEILRGTQGRIYTVCDGRGVEVKGYKERREAPKKGDTLVTTLDINIQKVCEKNAMMAYAQNLADSVSIIALNPKNGEIYAMTDYPEYNLNDPFSCENHDEAWRNGCVSDTYEPGSVFKIITAGIALEEDVVSLDDSFFCGGSVQVQGRTNPVRCWKTSGHGSQSLTQAVQHSCNAAFVNIGMRVGAHAFYKYCDAFGFLELTGDSSQQLTAKTGIDLGGESGSIWWSEDTFYSEKNKSQLAAASFGQTFTITPLQLITAVSACVNGGYLMQPYVVESLLDEDGLAVYNHKPKVVRRVISEETSKTVCSILEQVVGDPNEGTGRNAAVAGYRIGGKTGTSEKVSYEAQTGKKEYIVSFIGFAPADDPQIALLVMLDSPGSGSGVYVSGGQMAAPTVGKMFADILPYMGIEPKYDESSEKADKPVPDLNGLSVDDAKTKLSENGFDCRLIGSGTTVTAQLPLTGCVIAEGSTVIIYADASPSAALETMPGIKGLSYADAVKELSKYGVFARSNTVVRDAENQKVLTQSVKAGADIKHGTVVEVTLVSDDESILGRY